MSSMCPSSVEALADAIDDLMQLRSDRGVFDDPACQCEGSRIEQTPGSPLAPFFVSRMLPLLGNIRDALDADHAFPVETHDGVVGLLICEHRALVALEGFRLGLPMQGKRLD